MNILLFKLGLVVLLATQIRCQTYKYPLGCDKDCTFFLYWSNKGDHTVFTLTTKIPAKLAGSVWTAFALSKDESMVSDLDESIFYRQASISIRF